MFEKVLKTIVHTCLILVELYLFIEVQIGIYYLDEEQIIVNGFMLFAMTCLYVSIFIASIMISCSWQKNMNKNTKKRIKSVDKEK